MFTVNSRRGVGLGSDAGLVAGEVRTDATAVRALLAQCPAARVTPLVEAPALARELGVQALHVKDERSRMGLGSFKALGAAFAIAKRAVANADSGDPVGALKGETFVCASAGNHGLSVAAGARVFGARSVVYLALTVSQGFAEKLRAKGAEVVRAGEDYEASLRAAEQAAEENGWHLLSDSSWAGYAAWPLDVMEGYLAMGAEVADQIATPPTHVFLQAGVGGLAAAAAASARAHWGDGPKIIVVEPDAARVIIEGVLAGRALNVPGPVSNMGRLDCKEASHLALGYLAREADAFMTVSDAQAAEMVARLPAHGLDSSPSGAAGLAGLAAVDAAAVGLDSASRVLVYLSEGPVDE